MTSRLEQAFKVKLRPAAVGIDIGSSTSKAALAFKARSTIHHEKTVQILRVQVPQDRDHPERPENPSISQFEFVAQACLQDGKLIPGRRALGKNQSWSLKAILMHLAGVSKHAIRRMPGGNDLLNACRDGTITREMEEDALYEHCELIRQMVIEKAAAGFLQIKKVVLTYPNYLCEQERDQDFARYTSYYLDLMRSLWSEEIQFYTTMEGMSLALYVCEPFEDGLASCNWPKVWRDYGLLYEDACANVLVVDMGGSTLNLQLLSLYFDLHQKGVMLNCQSSFDPDWKLGALGGSQLTNTAIKEIIRRELGKLFEIQFVPSDEFARLMYRFEECKWAIDYRRQKKKIVLSGNDDQFRVKLRPDELKEVFTCFDQPINVFKKELQRVVEIGKDFVVVFAGGSFSQPGLRKEMDTYMGDFEHKTKENTSVTVKHLFLEKHDRNWSSAVSIGAAISVLRLPPPVEVLSNSAIGIQELTKTQVNTDDWDGSPTASFLFAKGCGRPLCLDTTTSKKKKSKRSRRRKFALVCDPSYPMKRTPCAPCAEQNSYPPIQIGRSADVHISGPLSTYDLGWYVLASELPMGNIRFGLHGEDVDRLAEQSDCPALAKKEQLIILLSCRKVDRDGQEVLDDPLNKLWKLTLQTDPTSKLLVVEEIK